MNKRCFILFCLFCTAFSQSVLPSDIIMSLRSLVNGNKKVAFIGYMNSFKPNEIVSCNIIKEKKTIHSFSREVKTIESEQDFFPKNYSKEYFSSLDYIVGDQNKSYKKKDYLKKKIDFFVIPPSLSYLDPSKEGNLLQEINDKYFEKGLTNNSYKPFFFRKRPDILFEPDYFYRGKDCKEYFKDTIVSDEGTLLKNNKKVIFCSCASPSVRAPVFSDEDISSRIKRVSFRKKELLEIIEKLKHYCMSFDFNISDRLLSAKLNAEQLISLFKSPVVNEKSSLLGFLSQISDVKLSAELNYLSNEEVDPCGEVSSKAFFLTLFKDFSFLRDLVLILDSQQEKDVTFVFLEDCKNSIEEICDELKRLGYKDDIKSNFVPETWRPIPPKVFEIFINRVLRCCNVCGKQANKKCTTCKATYCSRDCQKKDWGKHKEICLKLKEEMAKKTKK